MGIPAPKPVRVASPQVRLPADIPFVGCVSGSAKTFVGEQLGNIPDATKILQIRAIKKALEEQIYALIQGQLPDPVRPPVYAARAAQLTSQVAGIVSALTQTIAQASAEVNAAINFVNQQKTAIQNSLNELAAVPSEQLTASQRLMMQRYNEYLGELNSQIGRLQSTLGCLS
jgi:hypothetical protein